MRLTHGRITLELHQLAQRSGPALLLLHALGGSSADWSAPSGALGEPTATWPGSVYALDFCGHGRSQRLTGGGYYPELLLGDADAALAHMGRGVIAGAGVGAYVSLLLAGTRTNLVPAALLLPGAGLDGGGASPDFTNKFPEFLMSRTAGADQHDPLAGALDLFVRPIDYAEAFARAARHLLLWEDGAQRPPWWEAARRSPSALALDGDARSAFRHLSEMATGD